MKDVVVDCVQWSRHKIEFASYERKPSPYIDIEKIPDTPAPLQSCLDRFHGDEHRSSLGKTSVGIGEQHDSFLPN
jgi:hypothetical protein